MKLTLVSLFIFLDICTVFSQKTDTDDINLLLRRAQYQQIIELTNHAQHANNEMLLIKAYAYTQLKKYPEALDIYHSLEKNENVSTEVTVNMANCYFSIGEYGNAAKYYQQLALADSSNLFFKLKLAECLAESGNIVSAINLYKVITKTDTTQQYAHHELAKNYLLINQTDSAIMVLNKAVNTNPAYLANINLLTQLYFKKEEHLQALYSTNKYIAQGKYSKTVNRYNAWAYCKNGLYADALERFRIAYFMNNDTSKLTQKYYGMACIINNEFELAEQLIKSAYRKDETDATICYYYGIALANTGQYAKSLEHLEKAYELMKPAPSLVLNLFKYKAENYKKLGKPAKALEALMEAQNELPEDTLIIYEIAVHYDFEMNNRKKAIEYYDKFIATRPNKELPNDRKNEIVVSYYNAAINRRNALREAEFWVE